MCRLLLLALTALIATPLAADDCDRHHRRHHPRIIVVERPRIRDWDEDRYERRHEGSWRRRSHFCPPPPPWQEPRSRVEMELPVPPHGRLHLRLR